MNTASRTKLRIMLVEDSEDDALLIVRTLRKSGFEPTAVRVDTSDAMEKALASGPWDVVVADHAMPQFSAMAALELARRHDPDMPFLIVSGVICEEAAVAAMKAGAHDYLRKDNLARLGGAIERELREAQTRRSKRAAEDALAKSAKELTEQREALSQKNAALREVLAQIETEKDDIRQNVTRNAEKFLLPIVRRLRRKAAGDVSEAQLALLERAIRDLTVEFGAKGDGALTKLTPRQMELCHLIRGGLSNKEIASSLGVSTRTIETHRNIIRRKLGIARKDIHLATYLDTVL